MQGTAKRLHGPPETKGGTFIAKGGGQFASSNLGGHPGALSDSAGEVICGAKKVFRGSHEVFRVTNGYFATDYLPSVPEQRWPEPPRRCSASARGVLPQITPAPRRRTFRARRITAFPLLLFALFQVTSL